MLRILHFSDLHIGVENYSQTDPTTGLSTRLLDFLRVLDDLVDYAIKEDIDLVLFSGDAYKSRDPSQTHQRELAKRLGKLTSSGIPVYLLIGNHDLPHALGRATAVEIFNTLKVPKIYIGDSLNTQFIETRNGQVQIVSLPWPNRSKILSRQDTRHLSIEKINNRIQEILTEGLRNEVRKLDNSIPAILVGHVTVSGATSGSEQRMMLGKDHVLLMSSIHLPQFDYIALGHIHTHQILRNNPMVVYAGSLQRVDFSEEDDTKGFCVIDLDPSLLPGQRLTDFQFQEVGARRFLTIDVELQSNDTNPTETILHHISQHHVDEAVVRLRIRLPGELEPMIDEEKLRTALLKAHYIAAISKDIIRERRTRVSPGTLEVLSPTEALQLYMESRKMTEEKSQKLLEHAQHLIEMEFEEDK